MDMYQSRLDSTAPSREWITAAEAASILGTSMGFIKTRIKIGRIPSQLLGKQHRIPKKEFEKYIKSKKL